MKIKNMKSLEKRFKNISEKNPNLGSYICFAEAIKHRNFTPDMISRWFSKSVDKDDYNPRERKAILKFLYGLSSSKNIAEDNEKQG